MTEIPMPVIEIDGKKWIKLNDIDDSFLFRSYDFSKPVKVKEPSDHRITQVTGEGSPKCRPKKAWNLIDFK